MSRLAARVLQALRSGFDSLRDSPRELWLSQALNVIDSWAYFSLSLLFTLLASETFGYSDTEAGALYGIWGAAMTGYQLVFGPVIDYLGIRASYLLCFALTIIGRGIIATAQSRLVFLLAMFGPATAAASLGSTINIVAVKRYTSEENRGIAFSLYYTVLNSAALLNGLLLDVFRISLGRGLQWQAWGADSVFNSGYRLYMALGCLTSLLGIVVSLVLRSGIGLHHASKRTASSVLQPDDSAQAPASKTRGQTTAAAEATEQPLAPDQHRLTEDEPAQAAAGAAADGVQRQVSALELERSPSLLAEQRSMPDLGWQGKLQAALAEGKALVSNPEFAKFLAMCIVTINLKTIFRHLDATLPKFQVRKFGCNAKVGLIYSINPAIILTMVPVLGAMTTKFSHFDMIHCGSYVSALSPFWLAAGSSTWTTVLFVAQLSIGEAVWSPRWYDYAMSVAPHGKEGSFGAFAAAPLFLGKMITGALGGILLQRYCPDNGVKCTGESSQAAPLPVGCNGSKLWFIIGALTFSSPLCISLFQRWMRPSSTTPSSYSSLQVPAEEELHISQIAVGEEATLLPEVPEMEQAHARHRFDPDT